MPKRRQNNKRHSEKFSDIAKRFDGMYSDFVEHPRYGKYPRFTGLHVQTNYEDRVFLHWHSGIDCRVPNTAIVADTSCQIRVTVAVTHYFDVKRTCRDCNRPFLFFAEEQKYWYETLGFGLESDCVRCTDCRRMQQGLARDRERYEELSNLEDLSIEEIFEMAECCLNLIENEHFGDRVIERVRMLLNSIPSDSKLRRHLRFQKVQKRADAITED